MAIPLTQTVSKSHKFGNHLEQQLLRNLQNNVNLRGRRFLSRLPLLLFTPHLHLPTHSLPSRHNILLPPTPLLPLLRPRTPCISIAMSSLASPNDSNSNPIKTVRAEIKGRVQGVFYRNWTIENAKELGLKGWVRNRRDGSVEALFSGSPEKVQEMEQRCRRGPPDAMVTRLEVFPCDEDPGTGFERRPTV